jgi:hypothetical protein
MSLNLIAAEKGTDLVLSTALIILEDVELHYALAVAINFQRSSSVEKIPNHYDLSHPLSISLLRPENHD